MLSRLSAAALALLTLAVAPASPASAQTLPLPTYLNVPSTQTAVVFRARTGRAGAVDVLLDGQTVYRQALATDVYNTFTVPAGTHEITIRTSYDGVVVARRTLDFQGGTVYALSFQNFGGATDYRLYYGVGRDAAEYLVTADW